MEFSLDPPVGAGPLRLGMTPDEARTALQSIGPLQSSTGSELAVHLDSGLGFSVGFGAAVARVNAIEVWRPEERDVVLYRDVDVFGLPALQVVERLRRHVELVANEDGFTARDLYLALWRPYAADDDPADEEGYFFQSALIARPGYDDTPAEAAARLAAGHEPGY